MAHQERRRQTPPSTITSLLKEFCKKTTFNARASSCTSGVAQNASNFFTWIKESAFAYCSTWKTIEPSSNSCGFRYMTDTPHSAGRREILAHIIAQPRCSCSERIYPTGNVPTERSICQTLDLVSSDKVPRENVKFILDYILISDR